MGHSVGNYAADVHAILDRLGLRSVTMVGWSMGAFVAWEHLRRFGSERISRLVIVDQSASDYKWDDWPLGFLDTPTFVHFMQQIRKIASRWSATC